MPQLATLISELKKKRAYHQDQVNKIDQALISIEGIDGLSASPVEVWSREADPVSIRYRKSGLHPHDLAKQMIKNKGDEVRLKDIFTEFYKAINKPIPTSKKLRTLAYQNFCSYFAQNRIKNHGLVRKTWAIEGIGREVYINVDNALDLQTEKTLSNPKVTVKELL